MKYYDYPNIPVGSISKQKKMTFSFIFDQLFVNCKDFSPSTGIHL